MQWTAYRVMHNILPIANSVTCFITLGGWRKQRPYCWRSWVNVHIRDTL